MTPAQTARALSDVFSLAGPALILGAAACIFFFGGTIRADRQLWGMKAIGFLIAAGVVLWYTTSRVPTVEALDASIARQQENLKSVPEANQAARRAAEDDLKQSILFRDAAIFVQPILWSRLTILLQWLALAGGLALVLCGWNDVRDHLAAEYYGCLMLINAGLLLAVSANELIVLFLALELISIPTYVLLYLQRSDLAGQEASVKYFLLSIFSSALLLFGFSYLYGVTGTTNIPAMLNGLLQRDLSEAGQATPLLIIALVMVMAGLGFKITAFPFHFYAPDVFQGTSISTAALLSFVPKVAGFAALIRVLGFYIPGTSGISGIGGMALDPALSSGPTVPKLFCIIAAMTMLVGNIFALWQDNLKRIFAYSSVAHAGYMLVGLAAAPKLVGASQSIQGGADSVIFYLAAYGAMTIGAFSVLAYLNRPDNPVETVDDLAGLSRSQPGIALFMALFLFSLIGIPLTAGFVGKLLLFVAVLAVPGNAVGDADTQLYLVLAVIMAIAAAIGAWYYLRMLSAMFLRTPIHDDPQPRCWPILAGISICALITLILGVYPDPLVQAAKAAVFP